ncbi:unnamed protein product [Effrenium voratum]|nr:unnamed protein product [Effrenium voratum]
MLTSLAPREGPDALYSGLLECPVTTRLTKHVEGLASIRLSGSCAELPATGAECLELAKGVLPKSFRLRLEKGKEPGCFISSQEVDQAILRFQGPSLHKERRSSFRESRKESPTLGTCGTSAQRFLASSAPLVNVTVQLDSAHDVVTLTLSAGDGAWFGVGFGATAMGDRPWAVIVDGFGNVTERKLENHQPGTLLKPSVTVLESKVMAGVRSVVLTRSLKGASSDYYTFDPLKEETVNFINAVGSGPTLSYHKHRTLGQLVFLPISGEGACVCKEKAPAFGEAQGTLEYRPSGPGDEGSGSVAFSNHCPPAPRSDLLDMRNPTCDLRNYSGGQIACHHMWSLLDADQDIPWPQQPIEYSLKFRFWVEEYNKSYHTSLRRATWGIASPVEYDVPKCDHQVKGCSLVNGSWIHTISGTYEGEGILSAAHFHCHAPTCLSMAMYRCPPKTKVCDASSGELLCEQRPVYGNNSDRFSEPGYIFQPPCLWGSPEFGLAPPPSVGGYVLGTVKTSNASYGHHGEMAWQQMYIFDDPGSESYI